MPLPETGGVCRTLYRLGLSANYQGFYQMAWAVALAAGGVNIAFLAFL